MGRLLAFSLFAGLVSGCSHTARAPTAAAKSDITASDNRAVKPFAKKKSAGQAVLATPNPKVKRQFGDENLQLPKGIKVTRLSPIFESPNTKSKVLADVEVDTVLIAREVSRRGAWLKVEDEDGNAGWMPRARTNFNMLFAPEADSTPDPTPDPKEVNDARKDWQQEQEPPKPPSSHLIYPSLNAGTMGGGLGVTLFQKLGAYIATDRSAYFGAQIGGYRYWDYTKGKQTYTPFFRFRWLGRDKGADFVSGPDLGVSLRLPRKSWVGALGYSWGWAPDIEHGGFSFLLRPSVEIGGPSRFGLESEAGWFF